ncbi:alpha/beta hydrolase [bacterium]|nr:alpha/beta hydrolase [bacterium]
MKFLKWLAIFGLIYVAMSAIAGYILCNGALHPSKRELTEQTFRRATVIATQVHASLKEVSIHAKDGIILKAWYFDEASDSNKSVILFHGLSDNRKGMIGYVQLFLRNGYNVLTPDWRAHGQSGGELATYGIKEKNDVTSWINWLQTSTDSKKYYALGESYGAAILLQSLENENRICAAVAESSFATFREAAYDRGGQLMGASNFTGKTIFLPAVEAAFWTASWKYSFDLDQISPLKSLSVTKTPVLLIHGDIDNNLPVRHSRLMYISQQKNPKIQFWESHAGHAGTFGRLPDEFEKHVIGWFEKYECQPNAVARSPQAVRIGQELHQ